MFDKLASWKRSWWNMSFGGYFETKPEQQQEEWEMKLSARKLWSKRQWGDESTGGSRYRQRIEHGTYGYIWHMSSKPLFSMENPSIASPKKIENQFQTRISWMIFSRCGSLHFFVGALQNTHLAVDQILNCSWGNTASQASGIPTESDGIGL